MAFISWHSSALYVTVLFLSIHSIGAKPDAVIRSYTFPIDQSLSKCLQKASISYKNASLIHRLSNALAGHTVRRTTIVLLINQALQAPDITKNLNSSIAQELEAELLRTLETCSHNSSNTL